MTKEAMKLALEALENSVDLVREDAYEAEKLYGNYPTRQGKVNGLKVLADDHEKAITALREALASEAIEQPAQQEPLPAAMKTVIEAMQADPDYAWSWHCNIAMAFVDAGGDRYTGNQGAARFMKMLANVEPAHELPSPQPAQQEPVAWMIYTQDGQSVYVTDNPTDTQENQRALPLYTTPPAQRTWVGLNYEDIHALMNEFFYSGMQPSAAHFANFARAIEAKLKEKNT